jgi:hypothetical protein
MVIVITVENIGNSEHERFELSKQEAELWASWQAKELLVRLQRLAAVRQAHRFVVEK